MLGKNSLRVSGHNQSLKLTKLSSTRFRPECSNSISRASPPFDRHDFAVAEFAVERLHAQRWPSFVEQVGVGAGADETDGAAFAGLVVDLVDQQEVAADVAFARTRPFAF